VLLLAVEGLVGVPVAIAAHGAQGEDFLGAVHGPAHVALVEAVLDQVAADPFADAGADRHPWARYW
jgi:hypothetical protein